MNVVLLLLSGLALAACGGREYGWEREREEPTGPGAAAGDAALAKAQSLWAERDDPTKLAGAIATYTDLVRARPDDYALLVRLSRAHYLLGELTDADTSSDEKLDAYDLGAVYGERALHTVPSFRDAVAGGAAVEDAVNLLGREHIEAIYWTAVNQGKWANQKGKVKVIFMKDKIKKMIDRVLALDERWYHGAGHRYLGAYWAALPGFAGQDLARSREHFDKAKALSPGCFVTRTLCAELYARAANDRALYIAELRHVLDTAPDVARDIAPENRIEKRKAERLLAEVDDWFDPEGETP